tara:strand:+ start:1014 stop:1571 length:558 start_codon:yes stop_codon:yes gene_type:complete
LNEKTKLTNEELRAKRKAAKKAAFLQNAEKSNKYFGRRYLGTTKNGKDIWITMRFDRADMQISLDVNGDLDDLLMEDAVLAPTRVTQRLGNKKLDLQGFIKINRKNAGGSVTPRTIEYIKKLINAVEAKSSKSHVNGKCSSLLFQYVTGVVFEGDTEELEGNFRWYDAVQQWNIPSGEYFTVDSF